MQLGFSQRRTNTAAFASASVSASTGETTMYSFVKRYAHRLLFGAMRGIMHVRGAVSEDIYDAVSMKWPS